MGGLYGRIEKGGEGATKLGAFTAVRKELRKQYAEPFFWAPFVYLGDPR